MSRSVAAASGLLAGAVTFGLYLVGSGRTYDYDSSETVGSFIATHSLLDPFRRQLVYNNHPFFSFLDHVVYTAGGHSALALRVLPIALAAGAVGLVVSFCAERWGVVAGSAAGLTLAANPTFAELSRSVRGYSLLCLSAVASSLLADRLLSQRHRRTSVAYVLLLAAGIATHVYALLIVLGQVAFVAARARVDQVWIRRWLVACALGALAYVDIAGRMLRPAGRAGQLFRPGFPLAFLHSMLSANPVALGILALLLGIGFFALLNRATVALAVTLASSLLVLWLWLSPRDLYPRFLIFLAPAVAVLAAAAVHRLRVATALVAVAASILVRVDLAHWTQNPLPDRQVARLVTLVRDDGGNPCVLPLIRGSLLAYTRAPHEVTSARQLGGCELVLSLSGDPASLRRAASRTFSYHWRLGAWTPMTVFSRLPRDRLHSPRVSSRSRPAEDVQGRS